MICPKCKQQIVIQPISGQGKAAVVRQTCGCGSKVVEKGKGRQLLTEG